MTRALLLFWLVACQAEPRPLAHPREIDACNLDSDCTIDITCDCTKCVARNKTIHVQQCPQSCTRNPCMNDAKCVNNRCQVTNDR